MADICNVLDSLTAAIRDGEALPEPEAGSKGCLPIFLVLALCLGAALTYFLC